MWGFRVLGCRGGNFSGIWAGRARHQAAGVVVLVEV